MTEPNYSSHNLIEPEDAFDLPDDNVGLIVGLINGYEEFGAPVRLIQFGNTDATGASVVLPDDDPEAGQGAYSLDVRNVGAESRALRVRLANDTVALKVTGSGLDVGIDTTMASGVQHFFANETGDKIRLSGTTLAGYGLGVNTGELTLYSAGTLNTPDAAGLSVRSNTVGGAGYVVWHAGNDGAGSSLDAGLFAGESISNFALLDALSNHFTGDMLVDGDVVLGSTLGDTVAISGSGSSAGDWGVGGELTVGGNATLGNGLTDVVDVAGLLNVGADVAVTGELSVNGNVTLGNGITDVVDVAGLLNVGVDLDVGGELTVSGNTTLGNGTSDDTTVAGSLYVTQSTYLGTASDDTTIITGETRFKGGSSSGSFKLIPTTVADPTIAINDNSGDQVLGIGNSSSTYQLHVYGDQKVTGELYVDGNVTLGTGATDAVEIKGDVTIRDTLNVKGQSSFEDPVTITDTVYLTGATMVLNTAYIDFDVGDGSPVSRGGVSWDGYVKAKHDGGLIRIYYWDD